VNRRYGIWYFIQICDLNPLNYHVWDAMLEMYHKLQLMLKTTDELKVVLQTIWKGLPQEHINKAVANFTKRLIANMAVTTNCGQTEHLQ